jgi:alpha-L-fucosidase
MNTKEYLAEIDSVIEKGTYKDNWKSLWGRKMPTWMHHGKFGIFIHWGLYSVPAFSNEWYSRNMYMQGSPEYEHHMKIYGPHKEFGYKDFIPMFTAQNYNPQAWAELFAKAGAKYCVLVAEHHDGFQMYKSELSKWNAYEMGPKRDVLGELYTALEKVGIVNALSSHRVEHWFFMSHGKEFDSDVKEPLTHGDFYWAAMPEPHHHDLFSTPNPSPEYLEDWLLRCCELVDNYRPKLVYFDWWIQHNAVKPYLRKFAAYYYNRGEEWGDEVTICYKHDGFPFGTATVDIERGKFANVQPFNWQTDTSIARNSWCWTNENDFKSATSLVCELVDVVSKNGVYLLNVGPKPDGTISEEEVAVLLDIGEWLALNGEAIYYTGVWRTSAEGPTKTQEGQFTDGEETVYTSRDIRFTTNGEYIYATILKWPSKGRVIIKSLAERDASLLPMFHGIIKDVTILGQDSPKWHRDEEGLHIEGEALKQEMPVVVKVRID